MAPLGVERQTRDPRLRWVPYWTRCTADPTGRHSQVRVVDTAGTALCVCETAARGQWHPPGQRCKPRLRWVPYRTKCTADPIDTWSDFLCEDFDLCKCVPEAQGQSDWLAVCTW